ncbi:MAG: hypothetical protein HY255_02555 [Betaproteobacteria bacterium]|nr:hypothetical protein [Betaproteobacteria bacterium]
MNPTLVLRIAAVIMLLHFAGHTAGAVLSGPQHGATEIAVRTVMAGAQFDFMGSQRSYWDFYYGFGIALSAVLLAHAVLFWQFASLAKTAPAAIRPFMLVLVAEWTAFAVVDWQFFFIAPLVMAVATVICCAVAFRLAGKSAS